LALRRACGRGFEHHLIGRIPQERPSHEMALDRLDHGEHAIDEYSDLESDVRV
jgi:hypothetical protein